MGTLYRIYHPATKKVVNLHTANSTGAVANGTRLSLYTWENNKDQKWELDYVGNYVLMRLARDTTKVINRHSVQNYAHVWTYDGTAATQNDSLINTETTDGNMRILLVHKGLYLTKGAGDNYLYWAAKINDDRQYFKLEAVDGGTSGNTGAGTGGWSGSRHSGSAIPVSAQNQYGSPYTNYSKEFQSNACYIASLISAAHGLGRSASLATAFNENCVYDRTVSNCKPGYVHKTPSFISIQKNITYSLANIYAQIKTNKRPAIVYGSNSSKGSGHFAVIYHTTATTSSGISTSNTFVMDPWQGWITLQQFLNEYPSELELRYCS